MCRCCQSCWEDLYWNCFEEKFCYDETIASYNADEDEFYVNKTGNGLLTEKIENSLTAPVVSQPGRYDRSHSYISSKIHEEDYREIQKNGAFLAPEILAVFANSQIFHDHQPQLKKTPTYPTPIHGGGPTASHSREIDSEKLIMRLEGKTYLQDDSKLEELPVHKQQIRFSIDPADDEHSVDGKSDSNEIVLRPRFENTSDTSLHVSVVDKHFRNANQHHHSLPYFSFRPASENDIFAISGSMNQISMTPEIPSISYSTLPKNYEDTPTIEKYKESTSLYSIQTANSAKVIDYTMPRYFRKSDIIAQSADSLSVSLSPKPIHKRIEKSKRLKMIRKTMPPLAIHLGKEKSKDKGIE